MTIIYNRGDELVNFGKRLRLTRKAKGLTQKELGEKIGVGRTTISEYESGKIVPRQDGLIKLSEVLNVSVDFLTGTQPYATTHKEDYVFQIDEPLLSISKMLRNDNVITKFYGYELTESEKYVMIIQLKALIVTLNAFRDKE